MKAIEQYFLEVLLVFENFAILKKINFQLSTFGSERVKDQERTNGELSARVRLTFQLVYCADKPITWSTTVIMN